MISVFFLWFDYWTLKEWKTAKVQDDSAQGTSHLRKCFVHFLICSLLLCLFDWLIDLFTYLFIYFFGGEESLNVCKPRTTLYPLWQPDSPGLTFHGSGLACLPNWLGMVNARWLHSMTSEIFLTIKFLIFQGCPTKQAAFLLGQPAPYNQLLIRPM